MSSPNHQKVKILIKERQEGNGKQNREEAVGDWLGIEVIAAADR